MSQRNEDIENVAKVMQDIHSIAVITNQETYKQGEMLNKVVDNVEEASE